MKEENKTKECNTIVKFSIHFETINENAQNKGFLQ
jgi:hypothetical protein